MKSVQRQVPYLKTATSILLAQNHRPKCFNKNEDDYEEGGRISSHCFSVKAVHSCMPGDLRLRCRWTMHNRPHDITEPTGACWE